MKYSPANVALWLAVAGLVAGQGPGAPDWRQWGGPSRDFAVAAPKLAAEWSGSVAPRELFRLALTGGHSAVAVAGGRVFVAHGRGRVERVAALSEGGEVLWEQEHRVGYASSNPNWDGPHAAPLVYGDSLITVSIDASVRAWSVVDGELLWVRDLAKDHGVEVPQSGYAASPLLVGERLLLPGLGKAGQGLSRLSSDGLGVLQLDARTGATVWQKEAFPSSHASPTAITVAGRDLAIFHGMEELVALDPLSGERLWSFPVRDGAADNVSFTPLWDSASGTLVLSHAYDRCGAQAIRLGAQGRSPERVWCNARLKVEHGNGALWNGQFVASHGSAPGLLAGVDLRSGELLWRRRLPKATILQVRDQMLLVLDEEGTLHLARPTAKGPGIVSKKKVLSGLGWTAPTLVGRTLYVRSTDELVALRLP